MNMPLKMILIISASLLAVIILVFAGLALKMKSEIGLMKAVPTGEIIKGVFAVKDEYVNVYLVKSEDGYLAFDAGKNAENMLVEFKKTGIDPARVVAVFLTHSDSDHTEGIKIFSKAIIFISEQEEQMINGKTARFKFIHNKPLSGYSMLADGQTVVVGGVRVKGILTPGHTPGSMCYLVNGKWLFSGDSMSLKEGKADLFNNCFNMDSDTHVKSLRALAGSLNAEYIFTSHYGLSPDPAGALKGFSDK